MAKYAESIIPDHDEHKCWLCGRNGNGDPLDRHEIFHEDCGGKMRDRSKELGLWVHLCHCRCHLSGVHAHGEIDRQLKQAGQEAAMNTYGWNTQQFILMFGKNYL